MKCSITGAMWCAIFFILLFAFAAGKVYPFEISPEFKGHEKIDAGLKAEWRDAMEAGDLGREVTCIVKTGKKAGSRLIKRLKKAGFIPETVLNTIITGQIEVGKVPDLVRIDDVIFVEKEKKLHLK